MSGIAGAIDLTGQRLLPTPTLRAMANALRHRGPDAEGHARQDGVALACRQLQLGPPGPTQPAVTAEGGVAVVFDGALFNGVELRAELAGKGHVLQTHDDAELVGHLWEECGVGLLERLRGQFALALHDRRQRRVLLARDRFGICPLYWSRQGDWLLFASEVRGLLASGLVAASPDPRGINHVFTFFALPGPVTCFAGVSALSPSRYLDVRLGGAGGATPVVREGVYWEIDFPDHGHEERGGDPRRLADRFEEVLLAAVRRRLPAEAPVTAYLSGGVDSGMVVALAGKLRGGPLPTFTARIDEPGLDESGDVALSARHLGTTPAVVRCSSDDVRNTYPRLVAAAEGPVIDTACAALLLIAEEVQRRGHKVALTGEGADEWLASYPWYKFHRLLGLFDVLPGLPLSGHVRNLFLRLTGAPRFPPDVLPRIEALVGGHNAWLDAWGVMSLSKLRFYGEAMRQVMVEHFAYDDLQLLGPDRIRRWHPLHRALYLGARVNLPGLLLLGKGDRISMRSAVQQRYPFLDDDVFAFLAALHPRWKLRGLRDKYLLRLVAQRWLPRPIAWKPKVLFQAPYDGFHTGNPPAWIEQLFSPESLGRGGYFDAAAVVHWRQAYRRLRPGSTQRLSVEMGLVGVMSTQLWHQQFIDPTLADLPSAAQRPTAAVVG